MFFSEHSIDFAPHKKIISIKGSVVSVEEISDYALTEEIYKYNLSYEVWLNFFADLVKHNFLNMNKEEFETLYSDTYIHDDTTYNIDIYLSNDTTIHYTGSTNAKGVELFKGLLYKYVIRPDSAEHIINEIVETELPF